MTNPPCQKCAHPLGSEGRTLIKLSHASIAINTCGICVFSCILSFIQAVPIKIQLASKKEALLSVSPKRWEFLMKLFHLTPLLQPFLLTDPCRILTSGHA